MIRHFLSFVASASLVQLTNEPCRGLTIDDFSAAEFEEHGGVDENGNEQRDIRFGASSDEIAGGSRSGKLGTLNIPHDKQGDAMVAVSDGRLTTSTDLRAEGFSIRYGLQNAETPLDIDLTNPVTDTVEIDVMSLQFVDELSLRVSLSNDYWSSSVSTSVPLEPSDVPFKLRFPVESFLTLPGADEFDFSHVHSLLIGISSVPRGFSMELDSVRVVPEPTTLLLMACGVMNLLVGRRRRRSVTPS